MYFSKEFHVSLNEADNKKAEDRLGEERKGGPLLHGIDL